MTMPGAETKAALAKIVAICQLQVKVSLSSTNIVFTLKFNSRKLWRFRLPSKITSIWDFMRPCESHYEEDRPLELRWFVVGIRIFKRVYFYNSVKKWVSRVLGTMYEDLRNTIDYQSMIVAEQPPLVSVKREDPFVPRISSMTQIHSEIPKLESQLDPFLSSE